MGETSDACIEREVFEETGIHAEVQSIAVVSENFLKASAAILTDLTVIP